jgi:hypothetical protein
VSKVKSIEENFASSELFIGGLSPFLLFEMALNSLFAFVEFHKDQKFFLKRLFFNFSF